MEKWRAIWHHTLKLCVFTRDRLVDDSVSHGGRGRCVPGDSEAVVPFLWDFQVLRSNERHWGENRQKERLQRRNAVSTIYSTFPVIPKWLDTHMCEQTGYWRVRLPLHRWLSRSLCTLYLTAAAAAPPSSDCQEPSSTVQEAVHLDLIIQPVYTRLFCETSVFQKDTGINTRKSNYTTPRTIGVSIEVVDKTKQKQNDRKSTFMITFAN